MARMIRFVSFALILAAIGAAEVTSHAELYRCKPHPEYIVRSKLDKKFVSYIEQNKGGALKTKKIEAILHEAERQEFVGDFKVGEVLDLADTSSAPCTLEELTRRDYYASNNHGTPVFRFINYYDGIMQQKCSSYGFPSLPEKAMSAERTFVEDFSSVGKFSGGYYAEVPEVRKAVKRYFKTQPGKKDFVYDAIQLRILYACHYLQDIERIVSTYFAISRTGREIPDVCSSYQSYWKGRGGIRGLSRIKRINKLFKRAGKATLKSFGRFINRLENYKAVHADPDDGALYDFGEFLTYYFAVLPTRGVIYTLAYAGIATAFPFVLGAAVYELGKRDLNDPKYVIYPINDSSYRHKINGDSKLE